MGEATKIQWCDYTFNPWIGCTKVAPGCEHCYAEADFDKRRKRVKWGPNGTRVKTSDDYWRQPLKWSKAALDHASRIGPTPRPRVFCASLADVFEDWPDVILGTNGRPFGVCEACGFREPQRAACSECGGRQRDLMMDDLRRDLFALIDATPHLDWLLVTKRPQNIRRMWPNKADRCDNASCVSCEPVARRENVWLLTSVSDQATAGAAIPELLRCRHLSPVLGVSAEPLLGPIEFWSDGAWCLPCRHCADQSPDYETNVVECRRCDSTGIGDEPGIDWIIVGGESGPSARRCDLGWVRGIVDQCKAAGVPCFVKQLGARPIAEGPYNIRQEGINDPKGGDPAEWPADLRVRQFPTLALNDAGMKLEEA